MVSPHQGSGPLKILSIFKEDVSRNVTRDSTGSGAENYPDLPLRDLARTAASLLYSPRLGTRTFSSSRVPFSSDKVCADRMIVPGQTQPRRTSDLCPYLA